MAMPPEDASPPLADRSSAGTGLPLYAALLVLVAAYLRFGYAYGAGDHDELVPSVLHLLDGALFTQDWLVQTVTSGINVRTYFLWLTALPSFVLPTWLTFFVLWVCVFIAICYGVYGLAFELVRDRLAAVLSVLVACVITVRWTLGSNAVVYDTLVPEGVAWALAVPAVTYALRQRWIAAGVLLGLAAWFHLLVGVQTALVLGVVGLGRAVAAADLSGELVRAELATLARFGGVFTLVALPILVPVALEQLTPGGMSGVPAFYIHAQFRNPHHVLFSAFETAHHVRFWPVVLSGLAGGWWLAQRGRLRHGRALALGAVVIAVLCVLAILSEVFQITLLAKLQFFKLTVLVTLIASILTAIAATRILPGALRHFGEHALDRSRAGLVGALVLTGLVGWMGVQGSSRPGDMLQPLRHTESQMGAVERWAASETPRDAHFAIPPSVSTFRSYGRRAVVADFTGFVFTDAAMQEWFQRLMDVAPIVPPPTGRNVKPVLDAAYHQQPASAWRQLRAGYGIDYAVLERTATRLPFEVAFENEDWTVYRIPASAPSPDPR